MINVNIETQLTRIDKIHIKGTNPYKMVELCINDKFLATRLGSTRTDRYSIVKILQRAFNNYTGEMYHNTLAFSKLCEQVYTVVNFNGLRSLLELHKKGLKIDIVLEETNHKHDYIDFKIESLDIKVSTIYGSGFVDRALGEILNKVNKINS